MNPIPHPYTPGPGTPPPELAGREALREAARIAIARLRLGRPARSMLLLEPSRVDKTQLLGQLKLDAEKAGIHLLRIETPESRSLPALLAPQLRLALLRLSRVGPAKESAQQGLRALAGFATALNTRFGDIEVGLDLAPEPGLADNGDLEGDLTALLEQVGMAARAAQTALLMYIDELQDMPEVELQALLSALHRCAQDRLPLLIIGAGLPRLRARVGYAKPYAERLFEFFEVAP